MSRLSKRVRRWATIALVAAVATAIAVGSSTGGHGATARAAANVTITAQDFFWSPSTVTIQVGDTVTWTNTQGFHNVLLGDSRLNQPGFPEDPPWNPPPQQTFTEPGSFTFVCEVHPGMTGTVNVEGGEPTPTPTPTPTPMPGVPPPGGAGADGNITNEVVDVQANGDNPPNETKEKAVDGNPQSKWLVFAPTAWLQVKLSKPETVVRYALTSANDAPARDPQDWNIEGSNDGQSWTTLDSQTNQDFTERFQTKWYSISNATAYSYYRLNITRNHGGNIVQLAELHLSNDDGAPPTVSDLSVSGASGRAVVHLTVSEPSTVNVRFSHRR